MVIILYLPKLENDVSCVSPLRCGAVRVAFGFNAWLMGHVSGRHSMVRHGSQPLCLPIIGRRQWAARFGNRPAWGSTVLHDSDAKGPAGQGRERLLLVWSTKGDRRWLACLLPCSFASWWVGCHASHTFLNVFLRSNKRVSLHCFGSGTALRMALRAFWTVSLKAMLLLVHFHWTAPCSSSPLKLFSSPLAASMAQSARIEASPELDDDQAATVRGRGCGLRRGPVSVPPPPAGLATLSAVGALLPLPRRRRPARPHFHFPSHLRALR